MRVAHRQTDDTLHGLTERLHNIFVGTHGMGIGGPSTQIRCDFDNDGFAWRANDASANQEFGSYFAVWNERQIKALDQPRPKEGLYDRYGAVVLEPKTLFAAQPPFLGARGALYNVGSNDLRLDSASLAIDQGVLLPNFNDRYIGSGPDLGCCEEGEATPQYGPRPPAH